MTRVDDLKEQRKNLIGYAMMKCRAEDWHGMADAANDLRETDAEIRGLVHAAVHTEKASGG